jgi:MFS family permease
MHQRLVDVVAIWRGPERAHAAAVATIALCQGLVSAGAIGWWTYYAEHERHFGTATAGAFFAGAAVFSVGGYVLCGYMMDRIGRRPTTALYVIAAVLCAIATFQVTDRWVMLPFLMGRRFSASGWRRSCRP